MTTLFRRYDFFNRIFFGVVTDQLFFRRYAVASSALIVELEVAFKNALHSVSAGLFLSAT